MENGKLYVKLLSLSIKSRMQYKTDFFIGVFSILLMNFANFSLIGVMVYNFEQLNGWTVWELLFNYSFWVVGRSIYGIFFRQFSEFEEVIVQGDFDKFLLRPISPFLQYAGREINYIGIGDLIVGIIGLTIAFKKIGLVWSMFDWTFFFISLISGFLIQLAISWIGASICFWTVRSKNMVTLVDNVNILCQKYPIDVFGPVFRIIVSTIIPIAFINYYPSVVLLNKGDYTNFYYFLSPLVAGFLILISVILWCFGIKRYNSSGT